MNPRITFEQTRLIAALLNALYTHNSELSHRCGHPDLLNEEEIAEICIDMMQGVFGVDPSTLRGFKGFVIALYHQTPDRLNNDREFVKWFSLGTGIDKSDGEGDV
jgi:hypothetical protein